MIDSMLGPGIDTDALGWREIRTSPKDGTLFLGFVPHSCGGYMCVFYWNETLSQWQNNIDGGADWPSHWMSLPMPPTILAVPKQITEEQLARLGRFVDKDA